MRVSFCKAAARLVPLAAICLAGAALASASTAPIEVLPLAVAQERLSWLTQAGAEVGYPAGDNTGFAELMAPPVWQTKPAQALTPPARPTIVRNPFLSTAP